MYRVTYKTTLVDRLGLGVSVTTTYSTSTNIVYFYDKPTLEEIADIYIGTVYQHLRSPIIHEWVWEITCTR